MTRTLRVFMAGLLGLFCGGRQCEAQSEIALVDGPGWESPGQNYLAVGGLGNLSSDPGEPTAPELGLPTPGARRSGGSVWRSTGGTALEAAAPVPAVHGTHYPMRDYRDWYLLAIVGLTFAFGCATTLTLWWRRRHQPRWMLSDFAH